MNSGPWCDEFPLCCEGIYQSPIDLKDAKYDKDLPQVSFSMEYMDQILGHLINTGKTGEF